MTDEEMRAILDQLNAIAMGEYRLSLVDGVDPQDQQPAVQDILHWLGGRKRLNKPWRLRLGTGVFPRSLWQLIEGEARLASLFIIENEQLDFREAVDPALRRRIEEYVDAMPRPPLGRS